MSTTKSYLVTGADFIGFICLMLQNHRKAFCQYNSSGSWGWLDNLVVEQSVY